MLYTFRDPETFRSYIRGFARRFLTNEMFAEFTQFCIHRHTLRFR